MVNPISKFENNKVFTESEAWMLFSIAALAEAVGWTLLVIGVGLSSYIMPDNQIPVGVAGRIHGMLFMVYIVAALGLYPALRWSRPKTFIALAASCVPYGSLAFELWAGAARNNESAMVCRNCAAFTLLAASL
jgi:integral membrane protein